MGATAVFMPEQYGDHASKPPFYFSKDGAWFVCVCTGVGLGVRYISARGHAHQNPA
jgi:hypothetical protein